MARGIVLEFENPALVVDDEDEATLAAIDEGIRDAKDWPNCSYGEDSQASSQADYRILFAQEALSDLAEIIGHIASVPRNYSTFGVAHGSRRDSKIAIAQPG